MALSVPENEKKKLYMAQLIRQASMGKKVNDLIAKGREDDSYLIICGNMHMANGGGVVDRVKGNNFATLMTWEADDFLRLKATDYIEEF